MSDAILKLIPGCSDSAKIKHLSNNKFSYTNNLGVTSYYQVYTSYNAYKKGVSNSSHRLSKSNSFYIAEIYS